MNTDKTDRSDVVFVSARSADSTLPQLADPRGYVACRWDLTASDDERAYWLALFRRHFPSLLDEALKVELDDGKDLDDAQRRIEQARQAFFDYLDTVDQDPARFGRLDILAICEERERILRRADIADPYRLAKQRENEAALALLGQLIAELDAMSDRDRAVALIQGVFAGNIFDLGATKTVEAFQHQRVDFHSTRSQLKPRPWLVDDLDRWLARWEQNRWQTAVLFVDNAGPDIVLGMLPLARELVRRGTEVLLAANTSPSLNDVTAWELESLVAQAAEVDEVLRKAALPEGEAASEGASEGASGGGGGRLLVLANGNGAPLIDLTRLDARFVAAVADRPVDLVILEGMGRAVESNFDARFTTDVLKIAMIKDEGVADAMGGDLFDLVFRFETG